MQYRFFFLFGAHYYSNSGGEIGIQLAFNAVAWTFLFLVLALGLFQIGLTNTFRFSKLSIGLLLCYSLLLFSLLLAGGQYGNFALRFLALSAGLLLLVSLQQFKLSKQNLNFLFVILLTAALLEALLGWWQFLDLVYSEQNRFFTVSNSVGVFHQINLMASFMATGLVLSIFVLGVDLEHKLANKVVHWACAFSPILFLHLIVITGSRTGWFGAVVGLLLLAPYAVKRVPRVYLLSWSLALVSGYFVHNVFTSTSDWVPREREIISLEGLRTTIYPQVIDLGLERPILGHGYGSFESSYVWNVAQEHALDQSYPGPIKNLSHPHNELLFWWIEGGLIALLALLVAAYMVLRRIWKYAWRQRLAYLGLLFPVVLHSQTEYPFYVSLVHFVVFLFFIYLVDAEQENYKEYNLRGGVLFSAVAVIIPVIGALFMYTSIQTGRAMLAYETGQNRSFEALTNVINPVGWRDDLEWSLNSRLLLEGVLQDDPELVQLFVSWALDLVARQPRVLYYQSLVLAYTVQGNTIELQRIKDEAYFLFPDDSFELEDIESELVRTI